MKLNPEHLYTMKIHDVLDVNGDTTVMRVPGGWVYIHTPFTDGSLRNGATTTSVFVPYIIPI
jgi:hypothetical protein